MITVTDTQRFTNGQAAEVLALIAGEPVALPREALQAGQALVASLWMAHDSVRELRRALKKLRRPPLAPLPADRVADLAPDPRRDLAELLDTLAGVPSASSRAGSRPHCRTSTSTAGCTRCGLLPQPVP